MPKRRIIASLALVLLVPAAPLLAQGRGAEGRVISSAGLALAEADLLFHRADGSVAARTTTDGSGAWRVQLAAGRYEVLVRRLGYRPATVALEVGTTGTAELLVVLEPVARSIRWW